MKIFFQMPIPKPVDIKEYLRCGSGSRSFIPIFAVLLSTGSINAKALLNPKLLYYTPGLWELTGAAFWRAFFFETPFVLFRGFFWALIPMMIVLYLIFAFKANMQYQKMQDDKQGK